MLKEENLWYHFHICCLTLIVTFRDLWQWSVSSWCCLSVGLLFCKIETWWLSAHKDNNQSLSSCLTVLWVKEKIKSIENEESSHAAKCCSSGECSAKGAEAAVCFQRNMSKPYFFPMSVPHLFLCGRCSSIAGCRCSDCNSNQCKNNLWSYSFSFVLQRWCSAIYIHNIIGHLLVCFFFQKRTTLVQEEKEWSV